MKNFIVDKSPVDLDKTWLLNTITPLDDRISLRYLIIYIMYLSLSGVITNKHLERLIHFQDRYEKKVLKEEIIYVLEKENFQEFVDKKFFTEKYGFACFFISVDKSQFSDFKTLNITESFIDEFKLTSNLTFASLSNKLWDITAYAQTHLSKISPHEINKDFFLDTLSKDDCLPPVLHTNFITFIVRNGYINDSNLENVITMESDLLRCATDRLLRIVVNAENIDHYKFIDCGHSDLFYIPVDNPEIKNLLKDYLTNSSADIIAKKNFSAKFIISLDGHSVTNVYDLNFKTFSVQMGYFASTHPKTISILVSFYLYIYNHYNSDLFVATNKFSINALQRHNIARELTDGFEYVNYNPFDPIPEHNKWLLHYEGNEGSNLSINKNASTLINFENIQCHEYRQLAKFYIWNDNISMASRIKNLVSFRYFLNYVYSIKTGKELSFYSQKNADLSFTQEDIIAYKNHVELSKDSHLTKNHYMYDVRKILLFLHKHDVVHVDKSMKYHLSHSAYHAPNRANAIPNDELDAIAKIMKSNAEESILNSIYYTVFYILLETEFRVSQVLTLESDCINETYKTNQFTLHSPTKYSPKEKVEQPITIYVKRQIDEIKKATEEYRHKSNRKKIKKSLFIAPSIRKNMYKLVTREEFNNYLKKCCKQLNLTEYTSSNLRDTHMTKSEEFAIRNSLSDRESSILTGHKSSDTTWNHYIDQEIKELLEAVHGIIIGNVNLEGKILVHRPEDLSNEDQVSNKCGFCSSTSCNDMTYLDCMMCTFFVTCLDRIPYFEEQIKIIDFKITQTAVPHDIKDLQNIKVLLAAYLEKLLILKGEQHDK